MKINIKEKEYQYISDYPNGWSFGARDHFKFPVMIGQHTCFIKRFERKSLDEVSGWQLLMNLKGKNEQNLVRVYDIAAQNEKGRDVYYVFFDCIQGDTLDFLINKNESINLQKLTEDLFRALQSIHIKNYWFTDFCEKNIFYEKSGRFLLADLDSTQSTSELPGIDTIGKNEYWILIVSFYREILHQRNFNPNDFNGSSLNYLQAVFLILRLKLFYSKSGDYRSKDLYKSLPAILNEASPVFKEIYTNVFRNRELAIQSRDIERIKALTLEILQQENFSAGENNDAVFEKDAAPSHNNQPLIHHFGMSNYGPAESGAMYFVDNGQTFNLNWKVQDAVSVQLFRNGAAYMTLKSSQTNIELKEFSDGRKSAIEYKLVATNSTGRSASASVRIQINEPKEDEPVIEDFAITNYAKKNGEEYTVNSGENFTLSWKVKHADTLEIYKNDSVYRTLNISDKSIDLKEVYDGKEKKVAYTLRASNEYALSISEPINISLKKKAEPPPEILNFEASNYIVENQESYALSWIVKNAVSLDLFRNDQFFKKLNSADKRIQLKEVFETKEYKVTYRLVASNGDEEVKSDPVIINLKERGIEKQIFDWTPYIKIAGIILGIMVIFFLIIWVFFIKPTEILVTRVEPQNLYEDSSITIYGDKFRDTKKIEVYFNDSKGKILSSANDNMVVAVPDLKNNILVKGDITVTVRANGYDIYSHNFLWFDKDAFAVKSIKTANFYRDSTITVHYQNLRELGTVKVYFNYIKGVIKYQNKDSLIVNVPELVLADSVQHSITLNVKQGIKTIYTYNFTPR